MSSTLSTSLAKKAAPTVTKTRPIFIFSRFCNFLVGFQGLFKLYFDFEHEVDAFYTLYALDKSKIIDVSSSEHLGKLAPTAVINWVRCWCYFQGVILTLKVQNCGKSIL